MQEKYKLLYEITKSEYDRELTRFTRIEDKTVKLLIISSIFILALTAITTNSVVIEIFLSSNGLLKIFYCTIIILFFIFNSIGLGFALRCLSIINNYNIPIDKQLFDIIQNTQDEDLCYFIISRSYSDYVSKNNISNEKKTKAYTISYYFLLLAKLCFILFIISIAFMSYQSNDKECSKNHWKQSYTTNK
jgi:hypothetical protein